MRTPSTVAELAYSIAVSLGGHWRSCPAFHGAQELDHAAVLTHLDGRQLHLSERFDDPGHLHIRGQFPATDYEFRKGERDSIRVAMDREPATIAALLAADDLIPAHRQVHERVIEHNRVQVEARRSVEAAARDLSARLPGARTRLDGTSAFVYMNLEPGEVRIGLNGDSVSLALTDVPQIIADAVVFAVSRFLPSIQTPENDLGERVDGFPL
ncbi:hypothetical protein ACFXOI_34030 [Streptomyces bacillaris]|uniref:hypothetical protein n=1 Tax=Streptomyces bacillaris TaxID=68179 RepID=UPI0036CF2794